MIVLGSPLTPFELSVKSVAAIPPAAASRRLPRFKPRRPACFGLGLRSKPKGAVVYSLLSADRFKKGFAHRMGGGCFFRGGPLVDRKLEIPIVVGAEYIADGSAAVAAPKLVPQHLVVMVNGIIGSAADWRYGAEQLVKKLPDKVIVHCSECNSSTLTFDGVDLMGERLAEEVLAVVRHRPEVRKISFVAHSMGGLVARYAIGRLYRQSQEVISPALARNFLGKESNLSVQCLQQPYEAKIAGLEPMNFITFATPHLGVWGHKQLPMLCGLPFLERRVSQTAHWLVGRSGKHLFLTDNDEGRRPLLLRMVHDSDDLKFISALRSFKRRVAYANANYDHVVGWRTSSIRRQHELPKSNLLGKDEKYPHIASVQRGKTEDIPNGISSSFFDQTEDWEEEMIRGLNQVPWERVDVSFKRSTQRYVAHNTIQVKTFWLNSDGADVVFHMIDSLLV